MVKIAICDDIPEITAWMKKSIQSHKFKDEVDIDIFNSGAEIYENAVRKRYDIVFMDIELEPGKEGGETGMDISKKIKEVYPEALIIFFSAFPQYKSFLINSESFRYIDKPLDEEALFRAVNDAIKRVKGWQDKYLSFKWKGIFGQINLKRTYYFMSKRPYIEAHMIEEQIRFRRKMDNVEMEVCQLTSDFLRIHKSYLVNKKFIKYQSSREVIMINGDRIPIGRKYSNMIPKS